MLSGERNRYATPLAALSRCAIGMSNDQLDAIFSKWHESAHSLIYVAMDEVCHFPPKP